MMKVENLKAYLANIKMTLKDFCEIIDCDEKYMSKVMNGHLNAGHRLAKDVKQATSGLIKLKTRVRKKDLRNQKKQQDNKSNAHPI